MRALSLLASNSTFLDSRADGWRTVGSFAPKGENTSMRIADICNQVRGSNAAGCVLDFVGGNQRYDLITVSPTGMVRGIMVLTDSFFNQTAAEQGVTLMHELLHLYLNEGSHSSVARSLGILRDTDTLQSLASSRIDSWLRGGCR